MFIYPLLLFLVLAQSDLVLCSRLQRMLIFAVHNSGSQALAGLLGQLCHIQVKHDSLVLCTDRSVSNQIPASITVRILLDHATLPSQSCIWWSQDAKCNIKYLLLTFYYELLTHHQRRQELSHYTSFSRCDFNNNNNIFMEMEM